MRDPENGASRMNLILPDGERTHDDSREFQWAGDEERFPPGCALLFKMHGWVQRRSSDGDDDVIITEDDYVDFMATSGGVVDPYFPPARSPRRTRRRFLFLGYSLYDWNFRVFLRFLALRRALSSHDKKRHFAIQRHPDELEVELWQGRNVSVYDGDLSEFCTHLGEHLKAVTA